MRAAGVRRVVWTLGYGSVLVGTSVWLGRADPEARARVVAAASSNLDHLRAGDWSVLLTSGAVLARPSVPRLLLGGLLLGLCELRLGMVRTATTFVLGHVGTTLAVAALLVTDALPGVEATAVAGAVDVGPSYGTLAVLGAVLARAPGRRLLAPVAVAVAVAVVAVLRAPGFTAYGHLLALVGGAATGWGPRGRRRERPPARDPGSVAG